MIPRRIHQIWLGPEPLPDIVQAWCASWPAKHPTWDYRLWRDADLFPLINQQTFERMRAYPVPLRYRLQSDLLRYELLLTMGGVYVDVDNECLRPLDDLLAGQTLVLAREPVITSRLQNDFMAARPGHPFLFDLVRELEENVDRLERQFERGGLMAVNMWEISGPAYLTMLLGRRQYPDAVILPYQLTHPCRRWAEELDIPASNRVAYMHNHPSPEAFLDERTAAARRAASPTI